MIGSAYRDWTVDVGGEPVLLGHPVHHAYLSIDGMRPVLVLPAPRLPPLRPSLSRDQQGELSVEVSGLSGLGLPAQGLFAHREDQVPDRSSH